MKKMTSLTRRMLSAGLLLGCALTTRVPGADPAPDDSQARFEVDFLSDMIDHHQTAVDMATFAEERSGRPELGEFAEGLAAAQAEEIATMQGWLEEWYGETYKPELDRKAERLVATLAELEGEEFDEAFLKAMSLHHAEAISMAAGSLLRAHHSELIDLNREAMDILADEIALMRGWLLEWHEVNEVTSRDRPDNRTWNPVPERPRPDKP